MTTSCNVVRNAAADRRVEASGLLDIWNRYLIVIEAACLRALMLGHVHVEARSTVQGRANFERRPAHIDGMECPALRRTLDPFARELMLLECMLALVQSLFVKHTQA